MCASAADIVCRSARLSLIKIHLENTAMNLADEEWNVLVDRLDGYSGSDIRSVVTGALYEPVRSIQSACHWKRNSGKLMYRIFNILQQRHALAHFVRRLSPLKLLD